MTSRHVFTLTPREQQILTALRRGDTTRQIAAAHGLGRQTVKNYLTTIYEKLGVTGRVDEDRPGLDHGFVLHHSRPPPITLNLPLTIDLSSASAYATRRSGATGGVRARVPQEVCSQLLVKR